MIGYGQNPYGIAPYGDPSGFIFIDYGSLVLLGPGQCPNCGFNLLAFAGGEVVCNQCNIRPGEDSPFVTTYARPGFPRQYWQMLVDTLLAPDVAAAVQIFASKIVVRIQ